MDPEKGLEAKERGNEHFRAGQWNKAIEEYEEVRGTRGAPQVRLMLTVTSSRQY